LWYGCTPRNDAIAFVKDNSLKINTTQGEGNNAATLANAHVIASEHAAMEENCDAKKVRVAIPLVQRYGDFNANNLCNHLLPYFPISLFPSKHAAFTLAEVLITLGIIGVVAAMTLPALIQNYKDNELASRTRKTVSVINQAVQMAQVANNTPGDNAALFDIEKDSAKVAQDFMQYFSGAKYCAADANANGCKNLKYQIKFFNALENADGSYGTWAMYSHPRIVLKDGSVIGVDQRDSVNDTKTGIKYNSDGSIVKDKDGNPVMHTYTNKFRAVLYFDINGEKLPNQFGRDCFLLLVYDNKLDAAGGMQFGYLSLRSILSGGNPIYTKY